MNASGLSLPTLEAVRAALRTRRAALAAAWAAAELDSAMVLIPSGLVLAVEGSDQHYGFRAHDDHYYISGCRAPGQVLVHDPVEPGGWILFAAIASQDDRVWHGDTEGVEALAERVGIEAVRPIAELGVWIAAHAGRRAALLGSHDILERPIGYGVHPDDVESIAFDADLTMRLTGAVVAARRAKDAAELGFMRAAAAATAAGHDVALRSARPGMTERGLQVEIEHAFQRAGAERPAYGTIAATGSNGAVLHASPGPRTLAAGELVLVDAGAEVEGYDGDVTRAWPVDARFTSEQLAIYDIVIEVQKRAIAAVRPGVEFRELHMQAARGLAAGLVDFGLLRGDPDGLVERDAHALFFPHGLGHLIGLATHDVGGWAEGRVRSQRPGLKYLRIDLPLQPNYVVTIEPGIYFVRALLEDPELRRKHAQDVHWERADRMLDFGGIRIEDDVRVTADGHEVLTAAIPKEPGDLERLRA
ncbi:MAG: aminopeptidase P family protein [Planctomycetota bacterium]|nr:aminopeptidase P family protein [Planctomycetota bacterium]